MQALPDRDAVGGVDVLRVICVNRVGRVHQEVPGGQVGEAAAAEDGTTAGECGTAGRRQNKG